jgi:hypothetical protein
VTPGGRPSAFPPEREDDASTHASPTADETTQPGQAAEETRQCESCAGTMEQTDDGWVCEVCGRVL